MMARDHHLAVEVFDDAQIFFSGKCFRHCFADKYKKAVLSQGNRAMPQLFFSV